MLYQMQASQWATRPNTQTSSTRTAAPYSRCPAGGGTCGFRPWLDRQEVAAAVKKRQEREQGCLSVCGEADLCYREVMVNSNGLWMLSYGTSTSVYKVGVLSAVTG
ncbi:hypothetical protein INR49_017649 [Caranx melampygus]|nr:hypothetical protein INR49_017649 [Caranx melampygus]